MIKKNLATYMVVFILILTTLTGCSNQDNKSQNNSKGKIHSKFEEFTGVKEKSLTLPKGKNIVIKYDSKVTNGSLIIKVVCPYGIEIDLGSNMKGSKTIETEYEGEYKIVITGEKASGYYKITYNIK